MGNLENYLRTSPAASRIRIETEVVLYRTALSAQEVERLKESGGNVPVDDRERVCELVAGGQLLAGGKIVKKGGSYFFKVLEDVHTDEEEDSDETR